MPSPGDAVPYPPYPAAGAAAQGALQYSLEATQLLVRAALETIVQRLPAALASDEGLKVHIQNSVAAAVTGSVAVSNMIPAVETGLAKEATLGLVQAKTANLDVALSVLQGLLAKEGTQALIKAKTDNLDLAITALRDALRGGAGKTFSDLYNLLAAQRGVSTTLWTDDSGAKFVRRDVIDAATGTITVSFTDEDGDPAAPGAGLRPLASTDKETVESLFTATAGGVGYAANDILARVLVIDTSVSPPALDATWMNVTSGAIIAPPGGGTYESFLGLTDAELALRLGGPADLEAAGDGTLIAINKRLRTLLSDANSRLIVIRDTLLDRLPGVLKSDRLQVDAHVLARYRIADEAPGATSYYGFLAVDGAWYIMQEVAASGTYRYANLSNNPTISGGYSGAGADKAWVNRAALVYDYLSSLTSL